MFKLQPDKNYPRIHNQQLSWTHGLESGVNDASTIVPIVAHDEAVAASTIKTHPENASFAEYAAANCMPESRIDIVNCDLTFNLTKAFLETDKLHMCKIGYQVYHTSFEDQAAVDELSGTTIATVLELAQESSDRQAFPLYNDIKMDAKFTGSSTLHADQFGLTASQLLEAVTFNLDTYYDALHFMTINKKLKTCQSGIKWFTLTRQHPMRSFPIKLPDKSKAINEFTFFGVHVVIPPFGHHMQYHVVADSTDIQHVSVNLRYRYNEWNRNFNSMKI